MSSLPLRPLRPLREIILPGTIQREVAIFLLDLLKTYGIGPSTMPDLTILNHEIFARSFLHTDNVAYAYRNAYGEEILPKRPHSWRQSD